MSDRAVDSDLQWIRRQGEYQLKTAERWLARRMMQHRVELGLPVCGHTQGPVPKLDDAFFSCLLRPNHQADHEDFNGWWAA